jgi:hypothetical protein
MNQSTLQILNAVTQTLITLSGLIASIAIPIVIYRGQKRRETLEFILAIRNMWVSIDTIVLQNPGFLEIADSFLDPKGEKKSIKERKKTWLSLMVLNAIYMDYLGIKNGFHTKTALQAISYSLENYVIDDEFYSLTQNLGAYDNDFRALCKGLKSQKIRNQKQFSDF